MKKRVITAIVALIVFIPVLLLGGIWLDLLTMALATVAMSEVLIMKKKLLVSPEAMLSFVGVWIKTAPSSWLGFLPSYLSADFIFYILIMILLLRTVFTKNVFSFDDAGVLVLAMLYIGTGFHYLIQARAAGIAMIFYALFIVWLTDSGAYLFGRKFGKHKLAPRVSPNKTWEGSIGGSLLAMIVCTIYTYFFPIHNLGLILSLLITIVLSIAGQFGDLVESALKRYYHVKDSGKILPGHGGILDRFDSLLFVLPILHIFNLI